MTAKRFRKIKTGNKDLDRIQNNIAEASDSVVTNPLLGGALIGPITFSASGTFNVDHGLGRNYQAALLSLPTAAVTIYETTSPDRSRWVSVHVSGACSVSFYVF